MYHSTSLTLGSLQHTTYHGLICLIHGVVLQFKLIKIAHITFQGFVNDTDCTYPGIK
jgi:hypothetical protein